ncbi:UNVERIFIED_CONTAM: hypothetical protein K2H54_056678 [Gekko kuhli]
MWLMERSLRWAPHPHSEVSVIRNRSQKIQVEIPASEAKAHFPVQQCPISVGSASEQQAGEETEIEDVPQVAWKQQPMVWSSIGESGNDVTYNPSPTADMASSMALMSTSGRTRTKTAYAAYGPKEAEEAAQSMSENVSRLPFGRVRESQPGVMIFLSSIPKLHIEGSWINVLHAWGTWNDVPHIHGPWIGVLHTLEIWHDKENHPSNGPLSTIELMATDIETVGVGSLAQPPLAT